MFEDEYRCEMNRVQASELLVSGTLKRMQDERARLQSGKEAGSSDEHEDHAGDSRPPKVKRPLLFRIGLPVAACLLFALLGILIIPQSMGMTGKGSTQYEFQPVQGNTPFAGVPLFGNAGEQPSSGTAGLVSAECSEDLLPEGILEAPPVLFGGHSVYLGFDESQSTYYAAYREEVPNDAWVVIRSADFDKAGFMDALKEYLS